MTIYETDTACIRVDETNPDHHLYRVNGGNWWVHYRAYPTSLTVDRIRRSLRTKSLGTARQRRDDLFAQLFHTYGEER
jgi:hypothetical protein